METKTRVSIIIVVDVVVVVVVVDVVSPWQSSVVATGEMSH